MVIYFKYLFDVVEANSKMKANNLPFLCSPPKTFFIDHIIHLTLIYTGCPEKTCLKMFFFGGGRIQIFTCYILCFSSSLYFMSGKITLHVLLSQDYEKYLCVELNIFPTQVFIKEK